MCPKAAIWYSNKSIKETANQAQLVCGKKLRGFWGIQLVCNKTNLSVEKNCRMMVWNPSFSLGLVTVQRHRRAGADGGNVRPVLRAVPLATAASFRPLGGGGGQKKTLTPIKTPSPLPPKGRTASQ